VRLTAAGRAATSALPAPPDESPRDGPPLVVAPAGFIELHDPSPLRVWSLTAFADLERLDRVTTYRLTEDSVARALAAGFESGQILSFLAGQAGAPVPAEVEQRLQAWSHGFRRVRLRRALVITPDEATLMDEVREVVARHGFAVTPLGDALVVAFPSSADEERQAALTAALRDAGFTPQWDPRDPGLRRRDGSPRETGAESRGTDRSSS
jgi:hypothetical protein